MAEDEEDDESFGDFKFASFPNQQFSSTSVDWGGFVNGGTSSKPFDPFTVSSDRIQKHVNETNGVAVEANKARGAIPLSIFGEEDDEPVVSHSNDFFSSKSNGGGAVKNGSDLNGVVGISDLISNLYYQKPKVDSQNGSVLNSISNVDATNPKVDGPVNSNSNGNDLNQHEDEEDDDGWEFKSAEWEAGNNNLNVKVNWLKLN